MATLRTNPAVRGVAPYVVGQVLLETQPETGNAQIAAPVVRGVLPQLEGDVSNLLTSLEDGAADLRGNALLIGRELAIHLDLRVGDRVGVYSPRLLQKLRKQREKGDGEEVSADDFVVRGIFDVGYYPLNANLIATSLGNAQDLYDLRSGVHGLQLRLDDPLNAHVVKLMLGERLGPDYQITTWMEENGDVLSAVAVEKNVMLYILFFIVLVAAFGITSVMITFVVQKTREIGVLKALGATNGQITWVFLSQSLVVGVFGVLSGFGLGMLAVVYRNEFLRFMRGATGFELFPASVYGFSELPALIVPGDIAIICGGSLIICIFAGLIPAWNAGRLDPVEALRHE
jgi:lipoprotein-releasing system permease protein